MSASPRQWVTGKHGFGSKGAPAEVDEVIDSDLESSRVIQLGASLGCPPDIEAITRTLLQQTALGDEAYAAVRSSVSHLVRHDAAWRAMVTGVVPSSLRAQVLAVTYRTSATQPADSVPAVVLAAVGAAIVAPGRSRAASGSRRRGTSFDLPVEGRAGAGGSPAAGLPPLGVSADVELPRVGRSPDVELPRVGRSPDMGLPPLSVSTDVGLPPVGVSTDVGLTRIGAGRFQGQRALFASFASRTRVVSRLRAVTRIRHPEGAANLNS